MTTTLTGEQEKINGQALVESHNQDWIETMRRAAEHFARTHGTVTTDDLHEFVDAVGPVPRHPNAFGAIFRGPMWKSCGFVKSKRVSAHARVIRQWQLVNK